MAVLPPVFQYYAGHGEVGGVGKGKVGAHHPLALCNFGCAAIETQARPAAWLPYDFNLKPVDAEADACAERFGGSFLGCKTRGKALSRVALAQAISFLRGQVHAVEKSRAISIHGVLNAADFNDIDS